MRAEKRAAVVVDDKIDRVLRAGARARSKIGKAGGGSGSGIDVGGDVAGARAGTEEGFPVVSFGVEGLGGGREGRGRGRVCVRRSFVIRVRVEA